MEEINQNKVKNKKHKYVCQTLDYVEHLLILASTVTGYVYISDFASLVTILIDIASWIKNLCYNCRN